MTRTALSLSMAALGLLLGASVAVVPLPSAPPAPAAEVSTAAEVSAASERLAARPNVVVVMADDMRFDDLRWTPYLRRLARQGVTFDNSFSGFPLCCPARASFLTGQLPHNHRVWWHERPYGYGDFDDSRTLATSLRAEGYRTGFVGKYLNGYGTMDSKVSGRPSHRYVPRGWSDWYAAIENPGLPGISGGTYQYFNTAMNINGEVRNHRGVYQTGLFGDYARRLVERYHRARDPFFLYLNYVAPHGGGPVEPDDPRGVRDRRGRHVDMATPARPRRVIGAYDDVIGRASGRPRRGGPSERDVSDKPTYVRDRPEHNRQVWKAAREATRQRAESLLVLDRDLRVTVRRLKRTGEWSNTVLMVTSDNGYYLGEHRIPKGKVHGHEPSLRVPLIVTGPGLRDGSHRSDPISTVDLSATVLDLAGDAAAPRRADGRSLVPTLVGGDQGWQHPVIIESAYGTPPRTSVLGGRDARRTLGIRTARYTFIRRNTGALEFYDLARDPHQMRSMSRRDAPEMHDALLQVWEQVAHCEGEKCRPTLPPDLLTDPATTRQLATDWHAAHRARYGFH